ncbi:hypothetical protein GCM10022290_35750 [Sagittula marina]
MGMVTRIAQLVARTLKRVLAKEHQKLQDDAENVRGLREQWEPEGLLMAWIPPSDGIHAIDKAQQT